MKNKWLECRNVLIIRPDNLGDLIMSTPAIRAVKETLDCKITVLTSSIAAGVAGLLPEIDEVLMYDLPWVKNERVPDSNQFFEVIAELKKRKFDGAILFTVFSQNPLPAAMLAYLAGIPLRLAYCRENPYHLLSDWIPEKEPYSFIRHQVKRDLELVASVGLTTTNDQLSLVVSDDNRSSAIEKLSDAGVDLTKPWLVLHAGVSELKRQYPQQRWIDTGRRIQKELEYQILLTGTLAEKELTDQLAKGIGPNAFSLAGLLSLKEFISLIKMAPVVVSVNTGTIHIAAAVGTPVVVLYAQTNPQHTPWKVPHRVLPFEVPEDLRSKNEVLQYVHQLIYDNVVPMPEPEEVIKHIRSLIAVPALEPSFANPVFLEPILVGSLFYERSYQNGF
ncbi:glycosyltransferase family 9 protein [Xanthocytophaga agilis]|uniref:Glycosyltransferase family 9 protein n=1 Tax=Xanthocytophaga agilis TaxID=3048010 RepID=A0AAE3UE85_9BACT|nr:glycosyltransferase family 9 protein [Xanthocytophaga agilis]MDJ1499982.1 glycosyltransferase family 9 protein [Xanthocytophaga agilis]